METERYQDRRSRGPARTSGQPCPDRPWLWGILLGFPMFMTGGVLMLTLIGAPFGIPLFHAGLALMLSSKPCVESTG